MAQAVRPRRSILYMPGSNARALEKARGLAADGLILDLEDAVAPDAKVAARSQVCAALRAGGYGSRELIARVNGLESEWGEADIAAAAQAAPDAILLPKVESADQVRAALALMTRAGAAERCAIWCMIETPKGVLHAEQIAQASPRIACLVMGTSDLTKELRARHTALRLPMLTSLSIALLAARAQGLAILDGVFLDLDDEAGFVGACEQGRELGFDGKTLIHPNQIAPCNRVFAPSLDDVAQAKKIVRAFEAVRQAGKGVVLVDGKLIENLHVDEAKRIVELAAAIERMTGSAA
jgi:citrate lyase subunit beta/citryl-CoA lyase